MKGYAIGLNPPLAIQEMDTPAFFAFPYAVPYKGLT